MTQNEKILTLSVNIGYEMLVSGAEVSRVEDTLIRILKAYKARRVDVFSITSTIIVTCSFSDDKIYTQTKRIYKYLTNFNRFDKLNNLAREICSVTPDCEYIEKKLDEILSDSKPYSFISRIISALIISGAFTFFFGGGLGDAFVSAFIGAMTCVLINAFKNINFNSFLYNIFCSFFITVCSFFVTHIYNGFNTDSIIIGNIMLLIPGIVLTNSLRDIINGDIITGALKFFEAIFTALAIAGGYFLAGILAGGGF